MGYVALEKLHQLYDGYRRVFHLHGRELLLLQESGNVYLLLNRCPHQGAPLHMATITDRQLRCPRHGITFDLRSGRAMGADACGSLTLLPLVYENNTLGLEVAP